MSLQAETRSLKEKLSLCESLDASTTAITGKKLLLLQSQMEQLQEENYRYKWYISTWENNPGFIMSVSVINSLKRCSSSSSSGSIKFQPSFITYESTL